MRSVLLIAGTCAWLAGCASDAPNTVAAESPSEREYPTGSNIPKKSAQRNPQAEGIRVHSREDLERIQSMGTGVPAKGSGLSP